MLAREKLGKLVNDHHCWCRCDLGHLGGVRLGRCGGLGIVVFVRGRPRLGLARGSGDSHQHGARRRDRRQRCNYMHRQSNEFVEEFNMSSQSGQSAVKRARNDTVTYPAFRHAWPIVPHRPRWQRGILFATAMRQIRIVAGIGSKLSGKGARAESSKHLQQTEDARGTDEVSDHTHPFVLEHGGTERDALRDRLDALFHGACVV
jgi:hypothetical protein